MMRALVRWNFDLQTPGLSEQLGLSKEDSKCLASMFENLLLYDGTMGSQPPPPTYISKDGFPNLNALNAAKLAAAKLTRAALGEDGALTLFIGARDANTEVADFCNDAIKRLGINYEDPTVVRGLYSLYFSEPRLNIQIGIIEALGRSVLAANTMPEMLQLLQRGFESIYLWKCPVNFRNLTSEAATCPYWIRAVGYENSHRFRCFTNYSASLNERHLCSRTARDPNRSPSILLYFHRTYCSSQSFLGSSGSSDSQDSFPSGHPRTSVNQNIHNRISFVGVPGSSKSFSRIGSHSHVVDT